MVKSYFSLTDTVEYMKKKEASKQSNKTRASLRDFVVLNINRNFYASVMVSSAELPESRAFKSSMRATIFVQNLKTMRVLQFSSSVIPKLFTV